MPFLRYIPREPISRYIDCLWYQQGELAYSRETILPSGTIELIVNLGEPHNVLDKADFSKYDIHRDAWVSGFQTGYLVIESTDSHMIGARFKPGGGYPFFSFPISELNNLVLPLDLLWGRQ